MKIFESIKCFVDLNCDLYFLFKGTKDVDSVIIKFIFGDKYESKNEIEYLNG